MDDDDDKDDTKRKSRNLSEKKRRDQFNLLVNELSSMVSSNSRKMDKSTVLKSTIAFLKNHNEVAVRSRVHEIQENWKPSFLPNEEFTHLILEALDGFIIVFSSSGKIHYTSESVTSLLGHLPNDLLHMTIYDMVYEEEQQDIYNILLNPPKTVIDPLQSGVSPENQVSFLCHVKRGSFEEPPKVSYEYVQFTGYFRDNVDVENMMPSNRYSGFSEDADKRSLFVGTGRLMTPQLIREMSIVDTKSEFTSRHSLEWKFLFLDHRAPPIIGYLPFEVLGTSGYDYYHFDDLDRVVTCHEALMQKGEGTSCFYRFLTKGQQWIWLQTRFYITYHQWNSKPEFVVCTHRVVSFADVMKNMRKNNGSMLKDSDENDSTMEDRKAPASTSNLMAMSPWSSKSSRASKSLAHTQESPNVKVKRYNSYQLDSDSLTSTSADSPLSHHSHHSMLTQNSSVSQRSRSKQRAQMSKPPITHSHFSQFSLPHTQASHTHPHPHPQPISQVAPQTIVIHPPPISTQLVAHHHRPTATQVVSPPFIDQSQHLTAIPVQPVYASTATVIEPIQPAPDYVHSNVVLTPAQNQIQDHLQRKHEELQNELRRVSEQLFMARYGIVPSIVNVSLPFVAPIDQIAAAGENSRCISTSSHISLSTYHEHPLMHHPLNPNISQTNSQMHVPQQHNPVLQMHQQHPLHIPHQYDMKPNSVEQQSIDADQQQNEDIIQYMQHQTQPIQPSNLHQMTPSMQQSQQQIDDFELMPFQMMNQQAQILFSSSNNDSASNK